MITREQNPHILLIRRLNEPFKGKFAFPGGFVDADENISDAAYRELLEETSLDLLSKHNEHVIIPLQQVRTFGDDITRDPRGWCITVLFGALVDPKIKMHTRAADDAAEAVWFPLMNAPMREMAFDHDEMIRHLVKVFGGIGEWGVSRDAVPQELQQMLTRADKVLDPGFTGGAKNPDR